MYNLHGEGRAVALRTDGGELLEPHDATRPPVPIPEPEPEPEPGLGSEPNLR